MFRLGLFEPGHEGFELPPVAEMVADVRGRLLRPRGDSRADEERGDRRVVAEVIEVLGGVVEEDNQTMLAGGSGLRAAVGPDDVRGRDVVPLQPATRSKTRLAIPK